MKKPEFFLKPVNEEDFYSESLIDLKILDPFKYKAKGRSGRGRPKKTDYSTIHEMWETHNKIISHYLDTLKLSYFPPIKVNSGFNS